MNLGGVRVVCKDGLSSLMYTYECMVTLLDEMDVFIVIYSGAGLLRD